MNFWQGALLWALVSVAVLVAHHRACVRRRGEIRREPATLDLTGRRW